MQHIARLDVAVAALLFLVAFVVGHKLATLVALAELDALLERLHGDLER